MTITIQHIADEAQVAKSTVSRVLSGNMTGVRISETTRNRVLKAAKKLRYRPSYAATALARGKTDAIGLISGPLTDPYFAELAFHAIQVVKQRGYQLLVTMMDRIDVTQISEAEKRWRSAVDGIMIWSAYLGMHDDVREMVHGRQFPLVTLGDFPALDVPSVVWNWLPGMKQMAEHLRKRGGNRSVGFVGQLGLDWSRYAKWQAFQEAFGAARRDDRGIYECWPDFQTGAELGRRIAADPHRPGVVLVFSDVVAISLINCFQRMGLRVPEDIAVAGMGGIQAGGYIYPTLTTIREPSRQSINPAMDLLERMIAGEDLWSVQTSLDTELVVGESA